MATNHEGREVFTTDELWQEFDALFPAGWAGRDVLKELAPMGWANSPLAAIHHPSVDQVFKETLTIHRNMQQLFKHKNGAVERPEPTLAEIAESYSDTPVEPERECQELVGQCLWDVFSDNHEVTSAEGKLLDLGSHRASAGFLAEVLNRQGGPPPIPHVEPEGMFESMFEKADASPEMAEMLKQLKYEMLGDGGYTYLNFYMGTQMVQGRADLQPVYEMIFRRMKARGFVWKYTFPRIYAVDMRPLSRAMDEQKRAETGEAEWESYDPAAAFEKDQEETKRDEEVAKLRASLDDAHRKAVEESRNQEPPATVKAYVKVYGHNPIGWPPELED